MSTISDQGTVYAGFVEYQLKTEWDRRESLESRGARLQQTASISLGLFAAALGVLSDGVTPLTGSSLYLFVGSTVLFAGSILFGGFSTGLVKYAVADQATIENMLNSHWTDSQVDSRNTVAYLNSVTISSLRPGNNRKAAWLTVGLILQGLGTLIGVAAFITFALAVGASGQP